MSVLGHAQTEAKSGSLPLGREMEYHRRMAPACRSFSLMISIQTPGWGREKSPPHQCGTQCRYLGAQGLGERTTL